MPGLGAGKRIAPMCLPAYCKRGLKEVLWMSVVKLITVYAIKDDILLESQVQFVALASLKGFAMHCFF